MSKKFLDLAGLTAYDEKLKGWFKSGLVDITDDAIKALFVTVAEGPADNEIWYTTTDGQALTFHPIITNERFGANIVSNTYENGKGIITFDEPITSFYDPFSSELSLASIVIPNSVTSIGDGAFAGCSSLTSITIPNSVTRIGEGFFMGCSSLTSITIPNSVTYIDINAFSNCSSLTLIVIPYGVTSITENLFYNCSALTSITIPYSVTRIRSRAFYNCSSLTSITFEGTMEQWNFIEKDSDWNYNVPATYVQCSDGQVQL